VRISALFILFILLLSTYSLAWIVNSGASLSLNGYDLAEWTSVHPAAGGETPPLLTAVLLRLPLVCATLTFAFFLVPNTRYRILGGIVVALMGVALLPPFEFLDDPGNWNYRQQLALAVLTIIGGACGLTGWLGELRHILGSATALVGVAACLIGLSRAYSLMQGFNLHAQVGAGGLVTAILFIVLFAGEWQIGQRALLRRPTRIAQQP
jgi:hypothetical protein